MKHLIKLIFVLALLPQYSIAGRIILAGDEWALSNTGFLNAPDASNYALNIATLFSDGGLGNFHAYSNNFSLNQSSLANTLTSAGHAWSTGTSITFDLTTLLTYDGIFLAGDVPDFNVLTDYINAGGNVYISGGITAAAGGFAQTWNPFLNQFGLGFGSLIVFSGNEPISSVHPIFDNVSLLYQAGGQEVFDISPGDPKSQVLEFTSSGIGVYAIYDTNAVPVPAAVWLFSSGLIGLIGIARRKRS